MTSEQQRYEALGRAIGRRFLRGLYACVGTSLVIAFVFGVATGFFRDEFPPEWPRWLVFAVLFLPFLAAVTTIPAFVQWLFMRGRDLAAFEAFNVFALLEAADYRAATGRRPPALAKVGQARRWLSRGEGYGTRHRIRALIWVGELNAAAESLPGFPSSEPIDRFHQALLRQEVEYAATGQMDLSDARTELNRVPPSPEREWAATALAFTSARLVYDSGGDWLQPLADARAAMTSLPKGASYRDRLLAGLPLSVAPLILIGAVIWLVQFA